VVVGALAEPVGAEDWPCYRKDAGRSAVTSEDLSYPLSARWVVRGPAPRPAWPEPGRAANFLDFDNACQPVAVGGRVYFASSATDTLYALDAATGKVAWTWTADAPLRFAPHVVGGRCFIAGDDGVVACLDARTGATVWTTHLLPKKRMISGNGRMMSRWPCRTGVLVMDGVVYCTSGMWPAEGTYVYALDATDGALKWCTDTVNAMYLAYPHDGLSVGGPTPQGYLACGDGVLLVPTGLCSPAGFDSKTGTFLYWHAKGPGSARVSVGDGFAMVAGIGWQGDQEPRLGEGPLWESDGIAFYGLKKGGWFRSKAWHGYRDLPGAARKGMRRMRGQIDPIGGRDRVVRRGNRYFFSGMGVLEAIDAGADAVREAWRVEHPQVRALALAGGHLLVGGDGAVRAFRAKDGKRVWQAEVDGQARGLAIAGGALYVATDRGSLYAFAHGVSAPAVPVTIGGEPRTTAARLPDGLPLDPAARGYALVLGDGAAPLAESLAAISRLNVICLLDDPAAVAKERRRLLGRGYGARLVIHRVSRDGLLPYGDYFANRVLIVGKPGAVRPEEIYRVLHPCTGRLDFLGLSRSAAEAFCRRVGIEDGALRAEGKRLYVTRPPLKGAFDWNTKDEVDARVRWPLEMLWFGGPGRARMTARHRQGLPPPIPGHGRVAALGRHHVMVIDAYNGLELWARHVPGYNHVTADDKAVYVGLGGAVIRCAAASGRVEKVFGTVTPRVFSLREPRTFHAKKGNKYSGAITLTAGDDGIEVTLLTNTPTPDDKDCWMLTFDFRSLADRLLPDGRGRFPVFVNTRTATLRKHDPTGDTRAPKVRLQRVRRAPGTLRLSIPEAEIRKLTDADPASFDLKAELALFQGFRQWAHARPLTGGADPLRNGTATFVLRGAAGPAQSPWALVKRAPREALPGHARAWGRTPLHKRHDGNVPRLPLAAERRADLQKRRGALTGRSTTRRYLRSYGCSGTISSATMDFFRSGTLGMYDLADDSGMRNWPGLKPGCRITLLPALGVLVSIEGNADCFCPYSFATSLALAPATRRRNEDWALFHDRVEVAPLERVALNLGAPGDRRDEKGAIWLGYPRPRMGFATGGSFGPRPHTFDVPVTVETFPGSGRVRVNADRVPIAGTDAPWVCASGLQGIRRLSLDLVAHDPRVVCLASPVSPPPAIDGRLAEPAWSQRAGVSVGDGENRGILRLRCDDEALYLGYDAPARRPAPRESRADRPASSGRDNIWKGDFFDVILRDPRQPRALQVGVSSDGGRYGAVASSSLSVPRLENIAIDGKADDWGKQGLKLELGKGRGHVRLGWRDGQLLMLAALPRGFFSVNRAWTSLRAQWADIEARRVVDTVVHTAADRVEITESDIPPGAGRQIQKYRPSRKADLPHAATWTKTTAVVETAIPLDRFKTEASDTPSVGLCLVAFNPASNDPNITSGGGGRRSIFREGMLLALDLADATEPPAPLRIESARRLWHGALQVFSPPTRPLPADAWSGAGAAGKLFQGEIRIPYGLLRAHGLSKERLIARFNSPHAMPSHRVAYAGEFRSARRIRIVPSGPASRSCTVRLHFAELASAEPGNRVFDVKMEGKTVLNAFDIAAEAGGPRRALVKTVRNVVVDGALDIEFVPRTAPPAPESLPLLNGLEVITE
jgi:outer membrane protein assembly factor BamB